MPVIQSSRDNRISTKTVCSIDLTTISEAQRFHSDPEVKREATDLIDRAFTVRAEVESFAERLKVETIAELENKWADELTLKNQLEDELKTANLKTYEFTAEAGRINGRAQQASFRLQEHLAVKKTWVEALLSPKDRLAWESKLAELQASVEASRKESADLQLMVNCHNEDLSVLANRIRVSTASAVYLFNKIQRLKGNAEPILNAPGSHGLAS
jgi:hypothetical protein